MTDPEKEQAMINALQKIQEEYEGNQEKAHMIADAILCALLDQLGYSRVVDAYNEIDKWYA